MQSSSMLGKLPPVESLDDTAYVTKLGEALKTSDGRFKNEASANAAARKRNRKPAPFARAMYV